MGERVSVTLHDGIAEVRLERPEKLNALDGAMFAALGRAGADLAADRSVRVVVISGAGRAFCAGLDLAALQAMGGREDGPPLPRVERAGDGITNAGQQICWVWRELAVPVIAAVHGVALGGGLQLALGADLRIVAPDAELAVAEIRWGLVPDMTGTEVLPRLVGLERAKELTFTGRSVSGTEAVAIGLASTLADDPRMAALELAGRLAGANPDALARAKALLDASGTRSAAEQLAAEREAAAALIGSPNQAEAVRARFEKRTARFV